MSRVSDSGAVRDSADGKGRFDLLPVDSFRRIALVLEDGARHYGDNNWMRGMPNSWFIDSGMRHLTKFIAGETDEDHLARAAWNILCAISQQERIEKGTLDKKFDNIGTPVTPCCKCVHPTPCVITKTYEACEYYNRECYFDPCPDCDLYHAEDY